MLKAILRVRILYVHVYVRADILRGASVYGYYRTHTSGLTPLLIPELLYGARISYRSVRAFVR